MLTELIFTDYYSLITYSSSYKHAYLTYDRTYISCLHIFFLVLVPISLFYVFLLCFKLLNFKSKFRGCERKTCPNWKSLLHLTGRALVMSRCPDAWLLYIFSFVSNTILFYLFIFYLCYCIQRTMYRVLLPTHVYIK